MFLSELNLSLEEFDPGSISGNINYLHRLVLSGFGSGSKRVLFRLESFAHDGRGKHRTIVLVQSSKKPSWTIIDKAKDSSYKIKEFDFHFEKGARYLFRLKANPTVKKAVPGRPNGARVAIKERKEQISWLTRKGEAGGFALKQVEVKNEGALEGRKKSDGTPLLFNSVKYEGSLEVEDPAKLKGAAINGIGSGKAYGFGLLSLAATRR
jgi:CRISPR system Cascade subunit CasE